MGRELSLRFLLALFLIAGCCMTGAFASVGEEGLNSSSFNAARTLPQGPLLSPSQINFSQRSVSSNVAQYADDMANGAWN